MQLRETPSSRSPLPGLPAAASLKPSIADSQPTQRLASVAPSQPLAVKDTLQKTEGHKIPTWVKTVGALVGAGAVGVGVTLGLGAISSTLSPMIVSGVTALAGAGAFFGIQKLWQDKGPQAPVTDQEAYDKAQGAKNTRAWWKSGALCLGALLATGALGVGVDFGLKALPFSASLQSSIQTAISPALWGFTNAIAGAVTFLFIQKVTEPVGAWISRFSAKGSPIQANYSPEIVKSFIDINEGANAVNSLALSGAISVNSMKNQLQDTIRDACNLVDAAEGASAADAAAKIKQAGAMLGRTLTFTEIVNFSVTPDFPGVLKLLHLALGAYFENMPEATRNEIIASAIEAVKAHRPKPTDPRVPTTEAAIQGYFLPMLEGIINGKLPVAKDAN